MLMVDYSELYATSVGSPISISVDLLCAKFQNFKSHGAWFKNVDNNAKRLSCISILSHTYHKNQCS
jgi:hypothetical protein